MLYLALACAPAVVGVPEVEVSPMVATVVVVDFKTNIDVDAVIEFGETTDYGLRTTLTSGTEHHHALVGMASGTTVHWRILLDGEAGEDQTAQTDLLPTDVPELTTVDDGATWDGWLVTTMVGLWQGPIILDPQGRIVWYYNDTRDETAVIRAAPLLSGRGVLYNMIATKDPGSGEIDRISWEGQLIEKMSVPGESHDFVEVDEDTIATIQLSKQKDEDGETVTGDRLVEITEDGTTVLWDAFDWLDPATTGVDRAENSWTHANSLHWFPDEGVYRMGLRNLETIVTIDRGTGEPTDYFGGEPNSGWTFDDDERIFSYQHNFQWLGDSIVLFDNGFSEYDDTRVVEYQLDTTNKTATRTWSHHFDPPRWIYALGDVNRVEDGSTLVSWSIAGRLEQLKDDETIWRVEAPVGSGFGYLYRTDRLGAE